MKKYFILSSILSTLLIGDCLAAQTVNESRAIGNLPVLAEVFQNKREVAPEFPGGINALVKFISNNLKYPTICKELKIQGKVMVKFTVKSDGSIGNVRVTKSVDTNLDKEDAVTRYMQRQGQIWIRIFPDKPITRKPAL